MSKIFSDKVIEIEKLFSFRLLLKHLSRRWCIHNFLFLFFSDQRESGPFLIQSYNFPSYAFGLRNPNHQEAYINCNIDSNHNKFKFYVVTPGLTGQPGTISFKSTDPDRPNHYLRHRNFLLYLDPESSASLYKNDASFWLCSNKYFHVSILVKDIPLRFETITSTQLSQ